MKKEYKSNGENKSFLRENAGRILIMMASVIIAVAAILGTKQYQYVAIIVVANFIRNAGVIIIKRGRKIDA